jgi:hypothetical protein
MSREARRPGQQAAKPEPRSVAEAVEALTGLGYAGSFRAVAGPLLRDVESGESFPPGSLQIDHLYRFEGVSDPDDQAVVFGLRSPDGQVRGTYTVAFGPGMGPEDGEVVRLLDDPRVSGDGSGS